MHLPPLLRSHRSRRWSFAHHGWTTVLSVRLTHRQSVIPHPRRASVWNHQLRRVSIFRLCQASERSIGTCASAVSAVPRSVVEGSASGRRAGLERSSGRSSRQFTVVRVEPGRVVGDRGRIDCSSGQCTLDTTVGVQHASMSRPHHPSTRVIFLCDDYHASLQSHDHIFTIQISMALSEWLTHTSVVRGIMQRVCSRSFSTPRALCVRSLTWCVAVFSRSIRSNLTLRPDTTAFPSSSGRTAD
jgi:hypothetical protein